MTGKFDLQLLSQCGSTYNCLSRSVPEIHTHVAGTLSNQQTNQKLDVVSSLMRSTPKVQPAMDSETCDLAFATGSKALCSQESRDRDA